MQKISGLHPMPVQTRLWKACTAALAHVPIALRTNPWATGFLVLYVALRIELNLAAGALLWTALRSALVGLFFNALMIVVMDTIHFLDQGCLCDLSLPGTHWQQQNGLALVFLMVIWVFWAVEIVDGLQRQGIMGGHPLLSFVPAWSVENRLFSTASEWIHSVLPFQSVSVNSHWLSNGVLRAAMPLAVLGLLGYRWRDFSLTFRGGQVVAPFILIAFGAIVTNGLTAKRLELVGLALFYPGLVEELFYRGLLQRSLTGWFRPGTAVLLTALLFGLLHFPSYYFELYNQSFPLALLNVADATLVGLIWGYGFRRTGSVLPWAVYHALSDIAGF